MAPESPKRIVLVVMGVSGSGKSTIAASVAAALGLHFVEGDALHSAASVARMRAGVPLTDGDRWPWLDRIGAYLADAERWPPGVVAACSALKRSYRDRIRAAAPGVSFAFLDGAASVIEARMAMRIGHYMPASLLASQLQTLERPAADERDVMTVAIDQPASDIVAIVAGAAVARADREQPVRSRQSTAPPDDPASRR
ncbi:MAG TPA: gluconokinase [Caldimonas sp.]|jgi:carbohydrate kinase (thermoresistant glucokinase family)